MSLALFVMSSLDHHVCGCKPFKFGWYVLEASHVRRVNDSILECALIKVSCGTE